VQFEPKIYGETAPRLPGSMDLLPIECIWVDPKIFQRVSVRVCGRGKTLVGDWVMKFS